MSRIKIKTENKRTDASRELYGIFFEDINRAGDGGLYPELLRNRTFEDSLLPEGIRTEDGGYSFVTDSGWKDEFNKGEGLSRWVRENAAMPTEIPAWYAENAVIKLDRTMTLNQNRSVSMKVSFEPGGYVYNTGFCGICQKSGAAYRLTVFAAADKDTSLRFAAESDGHTVGSANLSLKSGGFRKCELTYTASADTAHARFVIHSDSICSINIGFISLMPADTYLSHGLRTDLMEKLKALRPGFVRFPGGCIVEGITPGTIMTFKDTTGPVWERPGRLLMWHYRSSTGLGFHEYLQMCEDLGAEPIYVCNCGMTCQARNSVSLSGDAQEEIIQDTLNAIAYAVEPSDSFWGKKRAEAGHPAPFVFRYIEIGNENWGSDYEVRYEMCRKAIHEKYPEILFIANAHIEKDGYIADYVDEHYYETAESFAETSDRFDAYDRKGPKILLGEVSVVRGYLGQLYGALGEAALLTGIEKNQDIVSFVAYAPLLENIHYNAWRPNLIRFDNKDSIGTPSYHVWKLFGNNRTSDVIETEVETGREYRPLKGMGSIIGSYGLKFRKAQWNGKPAEVSHELMGTVREGDGYFVLSDPTKEQLDESLMLWGADPSRAFAVFGSENVYEGDFSVEIKAEKGIDFEIGMFSSRAPKGVYIPDETHPPRDFNPESVQPLRWSVSNGRSRVMQPASPENIPISPEIGVDIIQDRFNEFRYSVIGHKVRLFINGRLVHEIGLPSFPSIFAAAGNSDAGTGEVVLKIVNMSSESDSINIITDCCICPDYGVSVISGEKTDENTFAKPDRIAVREICLNGASDNFIYEAPPLSVSVVRLKKQEVHGGKNG